MREADALVVNGLGFEAGLARHDRGGRGRRRRRSSRPPTPSSRSRSGDGDDPHFFTDPVRMRGPPRADRRAAGRRGPGARHPAWSHERVDDYLARARARSTPRSTIGSPRVRRTTALLVTNHEVFGYFADRYGFEVSARSSPAARRSPSPAPPSWPTSPATIDDARRPGDLRRDVVAGAAGRGAGRRGRRRRGRGALQPSRSGSRDRRATPTSGWCAPTPSGSPRPSADLEMA